MVSIEKNEDRDHKKKQNYLMYAIICITILAIVISSWFSLNSSDQIIELRKEIHQTNELIRKQTQNITTSFNELIESSEKQFKIEHFEPIVNVKGEKILLKRNIDWGDNFIEQDKLIFSAVTNHHLKFDVKSAHLVFWNKCYFESKPLFEDTFGTNDIVLETDEKSDILKLSVEMDYKPLEQFIVKNVNEIPETDFIHTVGSIYYLVDYIDLQSGEKFQTDTKGFFTNESHLMAYIPQKHILDFNNCYDVNSFIYE